MSERAHLPLFITYGGGHVQIALRLWRELADRHGIEAPVLGLTTAQNVLKAADIPFLTCLDCIDLDPAYDEALRLGGELVADSWSDSAPVSFEETCAYHGISMLDLIAEIGESAAHERFKRLGRGAFHPTRFMTRLLDHHQPGLTITTCNVRMEAASVAASRSLGIASLRIDDLFGYTVLGLDALEPAVTAPTADTLPDHIVVLNRYVGTLLADAGVPQERILPLGQPALSGSIEEMNGLPRDRQLEAHDGPSVCFFPAPLGFERSLPAINQAAGQNPDALFVVKFHPSTQLDELRAYATERPENVAYRLEGNVLSLIKSCDVIVTDSTTVTMSALFAGREMLSLRYDPDRMGTYPLDDHPAAHVAADEMETEAWINRMLQQSATDAPPVTLSPDHMFYNPLNATANVARLIVRLLQR